MFVCVHDVAVRQERTTIADCSEVNYTYINS